MNQIKTPLIASERTAFTKLEKSLATVLLCFLLLQTGAILAHPYQPLPECNSSFTHALVHSSLEQEWVSSESDASHLQLNDSIEMGTSKDSRVCRIRYQVNGKVSQLYATLSYAIKATTSVQISIDKQLNAI